MRAPSRHSRHRKPSHLGSSCHCAPVGISSTDKASMGCTGGRKGSVMTAAPGQASVTQTAGAWPAAARAPARSGSRPGVDPRLQLLLWRRTDLAGRQLAVFEQHQGRNRGDVVLDGSGLIFIDVELDDLDLAVEGTRDLFEGRGDHPTGAAPLGPEIDNNCPLGFQDLGLESCICDFAYGHWSTSWGCACERAAVRGGEDVKVGSAPMSVKPALPGLHREVSPRAQPPRSRAKVPPDREYR